MTRQASIQHVNLTVDDLEAADVFYGEVLGLERTAAPDLGFPTSFYKVDDHQELHINELEDLRPERAHFCLRVTDFNELFSRVHALDIIETDTWGKVRRLPTGVMQLFVRDPAGNLIELSCDADQEVDPEIFDHDFVDSETRFFRKPD